MKKLWIDIDCSIESNDFLNKVLSEVTKKQAELFDKKCLEALQNEALINLFRLTIEELKVRWFKSVYWIEIK